MNITIQGTNYTAVLDAARPLTIERKLNQPSVCALDVSLPAGSALAVPERNQRLVVTGDDGTIYFTGYLAATPFPLYAGMALQGPRTRYALEAVSEEVLLDQLLMPARMITAAQSAGVLLSALVTASGTTAVAASNVADGATVAYFASSMNWSASAASAARMVRASYRVLNGSLSLVVVQSVVHPLNETDGSLQLDHLTLKAGERRALANDITVCGAREPVAYVTEFFLGDGSTGQFDLGATPFFLPTAHTALIRELFNQTAIDDRVWILGTANRAIRLGGGGLVMEGGNGIDGETLLAWRTPIEMAGTLLLEADGLTLAPGSTGLVCGFYSGLETQAACICGFQVTAAQGTGAVSLQPLIRGQAAGTAYAIDSSQQYKLRIRVHCAEMVRAAALYHSFGDNGAVTAGGDRILTSGLVQMEIQPFVNGVGGMPVNLYDGAISSLPVTCRAIPCSSINLIGALRGFQLTSLGSVWVTSTPSGGGPRTRRTGSVAQAAECMVDRQGRLIFNPGFLPEVGELITVRYRSVGRAVGRAVNADCQQALAASGLPAQVAWIGTVSEPAARSSADCRNAAWALEQAASSVSALWNGSYQGGRLSFDSDVWPGDALLLHAPSLALNAQVVVRSVKISYQASVPDRVEYAIAFANDWACDLAIQTSALVPSDAWLPAPIAPTLLDNLNELTVTAVSSSSVTLQTGATPPAGGGFEIRRRDFAFMAGEDPDLVMRASTTTMTFARTAFNEQFFVRMYNGATPPNYSEFSAAIYINLPLSS